MLDYALEDGFRNVKIDVDCRRRAFGRLANDVKMHSLVNLGVCNSISNVRQNYFKGPSRYSADLSERFLFIHKFVDKSRPFIVNSDFMPIVVVGAVRTQTVEIQTANHGAVQ